MVASRYQNNFFCNKWRTRKTWLLVYRLSLNIKKSKYTFFHKSQLKTTYLWSYLTVVFLIKVLKENFSVLDDHIARNDHIHAIEKKVAKNHDLLYKVMQLLDKESLKTVYIHSYLNYATLCGIAHILRITNSLLSTKICGKNYLYWR